MCRCEAVVLQAHPGEAGGREEEHLVQGVGHADGGGHDTPQEAAQGHDVCAVDLVPKHSADRRAERLHMCVATQLQPGQHDAEPASGQCHDGPEENALVPQTRRKIVQAVHLVPMHFTDLRV